MLIKLIGAGMVVLGSGCFGFSMAAFHRREEDNLRQLLAALDWMEMELPSSLTSLPVLCTNASRQISGPIQMILREMADLLDLQTEADATASMDKHIDACALSDSMERLLRELGATLGRFDLPGQLQGIRAVKARAEHQLHRLEENRTARLRSYQTLGLCAGASLAIILL